MPLTSSGIPARYLNLVLNRLPEPIRRDSRLFTAANIDPKDIETGGARIPLDHYKHFLSACIELSGDPAIVLKAGASQHVSLHGISSLAFLSSPNILEGFKILQEISGLNMPYCSFKLTKSNRVYSLEIDLDRQTGGQYRAILECVLNQLQGLIEEALSEEMSWANIEVDYSPPDYVDLYPNYFHCPVRFNAKQTRVEFPVEKLEAPIASANDNILSLARRTCRQLLKDCQSLNTWGHKVRAILEDNPTRRLTLTQVSKALNISSRMLQRHLGDQGCSFQSIQDERAKNLAEIYLGFEKISVENTAALLGYSSPANFRRSFRRWFGMTPQQYRKQLLQQKITTATSSPRSKDIAAKSDTPLANLVEDYYTTRTRLEELKDVITTRADELSNESLELLNLKESIINPTTNT